MALQNFKNIIDNNAYLISDKDRKIFETGNLASFFGFSESDAIEFIIYDINDNQLPQSSYGLVRYIYLTTENISDYILIPEGTQLENLNFPKEYFVDIERLLKEAGYENGIFKTQITLINRRVGSERTDDKIWIKDISPSRLEIRLLPLKKPLSNEYDLEQRYNLFTNGAIFNDDIQHNIDTFLSKITPLSIKSYLETKYSTTFIGRLQSEYGIGDVDTFSNTIYTKFVESAKYEFSNRVSDINDINYGMPKSTMPPLGLSLEDIKRICGNLIKNSVNKYLINPSINENIQFTNATDVSLDAIIGIPQTKQSDTIYTTKNVTPKSAEFTYVTEDSNIVVKEVVVKPTTSTITVNDSEVIYTDYETKPNVIKPTTVTTNTSTSHGKTIEMF